MIRRTKKLLLFLLYSSNYIQHAQAQELKTSATLKELLQLAKTNYPLL